jgi:lipopolysaccharide transport system permease protein
MGATPNERASITQAGGRLHARPAPRLSILKEPAVVVEPQAGWRLPDLAELWRYRDLYAFLVRRNIRVRYSQSVLGVGWAIVQLLFSMIVFTVVFGRLAGIGSEGVPYSVFSLAALVPWTFFANSLTEATDSMVAQANLIGKIYFPRAVLPLAAVTAKGIDFLLAFMMLAVMLAWYGLPPTGAAVYLPLLALILMCAATGAGMWLTAMAVRYRDVKHAMTIVVQLLMYVAPVVYPASIVPPQFRVLYALNPMVGVIEGFRAALLATRPFPWMEVAVGGVVAVALLLWGLLYFSRAERYFADVA